MKLATKHIGSIVTLKQVVDACGNPMVDGDEITGTYQGQIATRRRGWVGLSGMHIFRSKWNVVSLQEGS